MKKEKVERFITIFIERFAETDLNSSAVLIAFYILLSLFPLGIAVGNILPLFQINPATVQDYLGIIVPEAVQPVLEPMVHSLLTSSSGGLLGLGALGLIWSASRGISYLQKGMNKAYGVSDDGSFWVKRIVSLLTILLMFLLMVAFVMVYSFGTLLLETLAPFIPVARTLNSLLSGLKWPITFAFLFCTMLLIYVTTPDVKVRVRNALPGAIFSTLGLAALVQAFALYLQFSTRYLTTEGTLGAFFLLMFWLMASAMIVLLGAVLNASIHEYRFGKPQARTGRVNRFVQEKLITRLMRRREERALAKIVESTLKEEGVDQGDVGISIKPDAAGDPTIPWEEKEETAREAARALAQTIRQGRAKGNPAKQIGQQGDDKDASGQGSPRPD